MRGKDVNDIFILLLETSLFRVRETLVIFVRNGKLRMGDVMLSRADAGTTNRMAKISYYSIFFMGKQCVHRLRISDVKLFTLKQLDKIVLF